MHLQIFPNSKFYKVGTLIPLAAGEKGCVLFLFRVTAKGPGVTNLFQRKEHLKTLISFSNEETMQPLSHVPKQEFRLCFSKFSICPGACLPRHILL